MAAAAAAKPKATIVVQGGVATKYAGTRPKSDFLSPEPDEDFIDPGDDYRLPWEEDPDGDLDRDLPEDARKDDNTFAASIGLEVTGTARFIDLVDALLEEYSDVLTPNWEWSLRTCLHLTLRSMSRNGIAPRIRDVHVISLLKVNRRYVVTWKNYFNVGRSHLYYMRRLTLRCCWLRNLTLTRSG